MRTVLLIPLLVFLASCRPASYEQFIRADQAQDGEYIFALDLSDSAATYDLSLYTRVDPALMAAANPSAELALQVRWYHPESQGGTPPEGRATRVDTPKIGRFSGTPDSLASGGPSLDGGVSPKDELPKGELPPWLLMPELSEIVYLPYGAEAGSVKLYRSGVKPSPAGEWQVAVTPVAPPEGLRGIGIICKRVD